MEATECQVESFAETIVVSDWECSLGRRGKVFRMLSSGLLKISKLHINFDALLPHHSLARRGTDLENHIFAHVKFFYDSLDGTLSNLV